jgi:hypothetical protein
MFFLTYRIGCVGCNIQQSRFRTVIYLAMLGPKNVLLFTHQDMESA